MKSEQSGMISGEKLIPEYFRLSVPVVLGSIITIVYNLADTYFIAQTGNALLVAGVSVCSPVFMILMAFGNIFGQGGSSLISRLLGQEKEKDAGHVSAFCFWIALLTGLVIGSVLLLVRDPFLFMLGASADTLVFARDYGTVLLIGAPFIVVNFIHMNLLRCVGMPGLSMCGTLIGAAVNVILDPILIPGLGAKGAALATVIGYLCSDLFLLTVVLLRGRQLSVKPTLITTGFCLKNILSIGITAAITNISSSICTMLINQQLGIFGDDRIAAMGIVMKVTMIVQMILVGFSFGGIPLFGFLEGAGKKEKSRQLFRFCITFVGSVSLVMTAAVLLASPLLLGLITPDDHLVAIGTEMLRWQVAGSLFAGIVMLSTCLSQATGRAVPALVLSLSRQGVIFVFVLLVCSAALGYAGIIRSQFISDVLSALLAAGLLRFVLFKGQEENSPSAL